MEKNLTTGSVFKSLVWFSLPYLLSYFLQTLYGMADLFIIGQYNGVASTTAVAIGSQFMHFLTVIIVGLAMGGTVTIARAVGAEDAEAKKSAVGNTITIFTILSIILTIILLCCIKPIAFLMATPSESLSETCSYLKICFIGIPFIIAYNIISSIFRGMGDSKSPMYFIAVSCVLNIALDFLFIGYFNLGAMGAALGTAIAQGFSVVLSLAMILRKKMLPGISAKDFKPQKQVSSMIFKIGVPVAVQDGFVQVAFLIVTIFANQRGVKDAAAVGIVEKMISVLFLVSSSLLAAVSALAAQNIGAGKHDRAWATLKYALFISGGFALVVMAVMEAVPEQAIALFTSDADTIVLGAQYMRSYVSDCFFAAIHFCCSGFFCAYGLSTISFIYNSLSAFCVRIPIAYFASKNYPDTLFPMGLNAPIGSAFSVIICVVALLWLRRKQKRSGIFN